MSFLFASLLLAIPAQTVGGEFNLVGHLNGHSANELFGYAVSGAGDINQDGFDDFLVGAPFRDLSTAPGAGSVFVYSGVDGSLLYQWDGPHSSANFGCSVSNAGDVNADGIPDFIVGALRADPGSVGSAGSAYVFSGADGSLLHRWNGVSTLGYFGQSVSGAGDVNADGYADVIVGEDKTSGGFYRAGSAYVYSGFDGTLLYHWGGTSDHANFGCSVSGAGDVNLDGYTDVIVGADGMAHGGVQDRGSAFVFSGADGSILHRFDGGSNGISLLGSSVSDGGDANQDGIPDFIVGAPGSVVSGMNLAGGALVYSGADGSLLLQFGGEAPHDQVGTTVSSAGDVDGDGITDFLTGSEFSASSGTFNGGSAYLLSGSTGQVMHQWDGGQSWGAYHGNVASAGDVNGDGLGDFLLSTPAADTGGLSDAGSVFVISFNPFLQASSSTVSASLPLGVDLQLTFPAEAAFFEYRVLVSNSGMGSGFYGVEIPLTMDSLVMSTYAGNYFTLMESGMHGTLDSSGKAVAAFTFAPGMASGLVGATYHLAAIANPAGQLPAYSSVAVAIEIVL